MKKFLTSFFVTLTVVFCVITVIVTEDKNNIINSDNTTQYSSEYKIMDYNGKLAVFKKGSDVPVKIYNVFLENLPESDRLQLKEGITCQDDAELQRLIEDYTS